MARLLPITGGLISLALVVAFWGNTYITDIGFWGLLTSGVFLLGAKND